MCPLATVVLLSVAFTPAESQAAEISLFDGQLGSLPTEQGFFVYLTNPLLGAVAKQTATTGAVTLDTTADRSDQAGYFANTASVANLDPAAGFAVSFDLRVMAEEHDSDDRAGFSIIVLDNASRGIELGFWGDEIWAQRDGQLDSAELFTHGEGVALDTSAMIQYQLSMLDLEYTLAANGVNVLRGPTRDYSDFGFPYSSRNFLFLGDDSRSASANVDLARVTVTTPLELNPAGDFNRDFKLDAGDIDLLSVMVGIQSMDDTYDLNGDGAVNQLDRQLWVELLAGTHFGDANLDGAVEFADFLLLSQSFGGEGGWATGDFDGNSQVGFPDFLLLSEHFGQTAAVAVPEPSPSWLVMVFAIALAFRRDQATLSAR